MYTSADTLQHQGVFVHVGLRDSLAWLDEKREEEGSLTKALQVARLPGVPGSAGACQGLGAPVLALQCHMSQPSRTSLSKDQAIAISGRCCWPERFGEKAIKTCKTQTQSLQVWQRIG